MKPSVLAAYVKRIDKLPETDIAYFAGLLDGEGCVRIGRYGSLTGLERYRAFIVIAMTDERPIDWLVAHVGGGKYTYIPNKERNNSKMCYQWTISTRKGAAILARTLPYLLVKRSQAKNFIAFSKTLGKNRRFHAEVVPSSLVERKRLFSDNKRLNIKGVNV